MDGGPLRAAPAYAGGNFDGGRGVDPAGKHLDAGHVLFFLHAERAGVRLRRAAAKPGAIVALVRTVSRESDGIRIFGNRVGRRGGAVDFAHSGATFWLASGASNAGAFDSGDVCGAGAAGYLYFRSGVWDWARRRLYDCSADDRGNFRSATPWPPSRSHFDCWQRGGSGVAVAGGPLARLDRKLFRWISGA